MKMNASLPFAISRHAVAVVALSLAGIMVCAQVRHEKHPGPEDVIAQLISLRHGGAEHMMPPEINELRGEVKENPRVYAPAIAKYLVLPPDGAPSLPRDDARTLFSALALARLIGPDQGGPIIRTFHDVVAAHLSKCRRTDSKDGLANNDHQRPQNCTYLILLRDGTLEALAEFADPYAVETCVSMIEAERKHMTEISSLRYLEKVAPLRPDIRPKLEEMYDSPDSPLRNHPQLLRVLEAIDKAEAERQTKRPQDNEKEREEGDDE
jgi:hypothetical protein